MMAEELRNTQGPVCSLNGLWVTHRRACTYKNLTLTKIHIIPSEYSQTRFLLGESRNHGFQICSLFPLVGDVSILAHLASFI